VLKEERIPRVSGEDIGGYSEGVALLSKDVDLYVCVGGKGSTSKSGYNGGGASGSGGRGGGATHMAFQGGELSTLAENVEDLLIVAGGGGGVYYGYGTDTGSYHGHGGGYEGVKGRDLYSSGYAPGGAQTLRGSNANYPRGTFGKGGRSSSFGAGGGGGYYGGNAGRSVSYSGGGGYTNWGGGGSGFLSDKLNEAGMWVYKGQAIGSVPENTMNISNSVSDTPEERQAKRGRGYARITLIE